MVCSRSSVGKGVICSLASVQETLEALAALANVGDNIDIRPNLADVKKAAIFSAHSNFKGPFFDGVPR